MKTRLFLASTFLVALLAACGTTESNVKSELTEADMANDFTTTTITTLDFETDLPNLSGAQGSNVDYKVNNIPANATNLVISISGGSGDVDMYVKANGDATTYDYDCRPFKPGNNETCTFASPEEGDYGILLRAYQAYAGVTLSISYDSPDVVEAPIPSNELTNGVAQAVQGLEAQEVLYTLEVPEGASDLSIALSGGTGDADMYVGFGSEPTKSLYDCRPYESGNNESCEFSDPQAGTYYIKLIGYKAFAGATLLAQYEVATDPVVSNELQNGVEKTNVSGDKAEEVLYILEVPEGAFDLSIALSGGTGDADLYVGYANEPTKSIYDCRSYTNGNNEQCQISEPEAGTYYVKLIGYTAFSGATLLAQYEVITGPTGPNELQNGSAETNVSGDKDQEVLYTLEVPEGASDLSITLSDGTGDADLYVRHANEPTQSTYDCRSYTNGNNEECQISEPEAGTYYVKLIGYTAFSGATLLAQYEVDQGGADTTYDIEFIFSNTVTEQQKALFRQAAARWESVIVGDILDVTYDKPYNACRQNEPAYEGTYDDLVIYANVGPNDGPGGVLASAGPCLSRPEASGSLPAYGIMNFDSADSGNLDQLYETILHEMGHVIGIGTLWADLDLVNYTNLNCPRDPRYTANNGVTEWQALGGVGNVPVEGDGGQGTACGHWDEDTFDTELMTGYSEGPADEPMSRMTIGMLEDMGYAVDYTQAEAYVLPVRGGNGLSTQSHGEGIDFARGEELLRPIGIIGTTGDIVVTGF